MRRQPFKSMNAQKLESREITEMLVNSRAKNIPSNGEHISKSEEQCKFDGDSKYNHRLQKKKQKQKSHLDGLMMNKIIPDRSTEGD